MKEAIFYLLKSGLWVTIFGMIYWFFLRKETFYKFNRFFLLFGLLASFVLPFCIYKYTIQLDFTPYLTSSAEQVVKAEGSASPLSAWIIFLAIHSLGVIFLVFRHMRGFLKITHLISKNGFNKEQGTKVVCAPEVQSTFSVFNYIFTDSTSIISETEQKMIYEHERAHINQMHWVDLVVAHAACIIQWFNPFVWLYLNSIKQNHEFLADQAVLKTGNSPAVYRAVLINYTLKTPVFAFAHGFAQYNKFKRIDMMKKNASNPMKKWVILLLCPFLVIFLWIFAEPEYVFAGNSKGQIIQYDFTFETENHLKKDTINIENEDVIVVKEGKAKKTYTLQKIEEDHTVGTKDSVIVVGYKKIDDQLGSKTHNTNVQVYVTCDDEEDVKLRDVIKKNRSMNAKSMKTYSISSTGNINQLPPLIIVDGVETEENINNINPENIESVSVLKDASATKEYGEKAKNGVVIITTKKGEDSSLLKNKVIYINKKNIEKSDSLSGEVKYIGTASSTLKVRGFGDLNSKKPLVIIDGVEFEDGIDKVRPENIESISVLKDGASTSIYGEKGKNGVIILSTKKPIIKVD